MNRRKAAKRKAAKPSPKTDKDWNDEYKDHIAFADKVIKHYQDLEKRFFNGEPLKVLKPEVLRLYKDVVSHRKIYLNKLERRSEIGTDVKLEQPRRGFWIWNKGAGKNPYIDIYAQEKTKTKTKDLANKATKNFFDSRKDLLRQKMEQRKDSDHRNFKERSAILHGFRR